MNEDNNSSRGCVCEVLSSIFFFFIILYCYFVLNLGISLLCNKLMSQ
jgi:hypothetical protein